MNINRLALCGHEIGHMSMIYWRKESLQSAKAVVRADGSGTVFRGASNNDITELMVKIAGPVVEFLIHGVTPKKAIRFSSEYQDHRSDSFMIRDIVRRFCNGVDSRKFQYDVQERTRAVIEQPSMWCAISEATRRLYEAGTVTGEEVEEIFKHHSVPTMFDSQQIDWVCKMNQIPHHRKDICQAFPDHHGQPDPADVVPSKTRARVAAVSDVTRLFRTTL